MATSVIILGALALSSGADYFDDYFDLTPSTVTPQGQFAHPISRLASANWAGYVATGAAGSFDRVAGEWVVPAVRCTANGDQGASFWAGLGGTDAVSLEQAGVHAICSQGKVSYSAFTEVVPAAAVTVPGFGVAAGNRIRASVSRSGQSFTLALDNLTTGAHYQVVVQDPNGNGTSAELIAERPGQGTTLANATFLPLPDFGTVSFENLDLGAAGLPVGLHSLAMLGASGTPLAIPTWKSGGAFSVTWKASS